MRKEINLSVIKTNEVIEIRSNMTRNSFPIIKINTEKQSIENVNKFFKQIIMESFLEGKYPIIKINSLEELEEHTNKDVKDLIKKLIDNLNTKSKKEVKRIEIKTV